MKRGRAEAGISQRRKYQPAAKKSNVVVSTTSATGGGYRTGGFKNRGASNTRVGAMQELKYFDSITNAATIIQDGWTLLEPTINVPQVGTGADNRIGRCIYIKSIHVKGIIRATEDATGFISSTGNTVRFVIVLDKQCNKAAASDGDIWDEGLVGGQTPETVNQFRNLEKSSRFLILHEGKWDINQDATGSGSYNRQINFNINKNVNIKDRKSVV